MRSRHQLADDLFVLPAGPGWLLNSYLLGDTVVDSGLRWSGRRIARSLRDAPVRAHALTHAHFDHAGSSDWLCRELGVPLLVGERDVPAMEAGRMDRHGSRVVNMLVRFMPTPAHPVERALREGDTVGGFDVLDMPGHTPGSIVFWRERDRVLLCGDTVFNWTRTSGRPRLVDQPGFLHYDQSGNRRSMARLAELRPRLACFGHGPPIADPGLFNERLSRLAG